MAGSDDLRFQMMGLGGPAAPAAPPPPAKKDSGKRDAGYPTFESLVGDKAKYDAMVGQAQKTKQALEAIADKGANAQAKADARKALRAYDHALDLLKKAHELTQQILKERQGKQKAAAGKKK